MLLDETVLIVITDASARVRLRDGSVRRVFFYATNNKCDYEICDYVLVRITMHVAQS